MYFILKIEIYKSNLMEYNVNIKNVLSKFFFCMVFDDN